VDDIEILLRALHFAADKHRDQRRKDPEASPYINHPIHVAEALASVGGVRDPVTLAAAILHDTLEDTQTTADELEELFGPEVRGVVEEVTDDKSLEKARRKRLQIEHAPSLSQRARVVKYGDKICNVIDVTERPPPRWSRERRLEYVDWAKRVVDRCRGANAALERWFDDVHAKALARIDGGG
jgi:guanosine-3',5'-bis(diphosphate) 3'-pyrophosphohydrolase